MAAQKTRITREVEEFIDADFVTGKEEALERCSIFLEKVADNPEIEGDVIVVLKQLGRGTSASIKSFTLSPGEDFNVVADQIVDAAVSDAEVIGRGRCRYTVELEDRKGRAVFALTVNEKDGDDLVDEPPTHDGVLAQVMSQNAEFMKMVREMVESDRKFTKFQMGELREENKELRRGQVDGIKMYSEMYNQKHVLDLEAQRMHKSEQRKDELFGLIGNVGVPVIMGKLMGAGAPGTKTGLEAMLEGFVGTFQPEQLQSIATTGSIQLRQEQVLSMLEIFRVFMDRQAAERQRAEQAHAVSHPYVRPEQPQVQVTQVPSQPQNVTEASAPSSSGSPTTPAGAPPSPLP